MTGTDPLSELLVHQHGVVSARQLAKHDLLPHDVKRMLRRRELASVHRGVYVDHTGLLSRDQRAWAAVLVHWPAALTRESALPDASADGPVHVAIALDRSATRVDGVVAHRTPDLDTRVRWNASPPRVRVEHALIDVASARRDDVAAFRVLADACQGRHTTPERIAAVLADRTRVPGRALLVALLDDLGAGACSVLEREWLRLQQAHGLPLGERQVAAEGSRGRTYRDVVLAELGLVVELDGRAHHDDAASRDRDAERDLDAAVDGLATTVRLTYGQVFRDGCRTAHRLGTLLQTRGWAGRTTRCGPGCDQPPATGRDPGPPDGPGSRPSPPAPGPRAA